MADTHNSEGHGGAGLTGYLVIFGALSVFTIVSFIANGAATAGSIPVETSLAIIMGVAVCKAVLVGLFFMHLKLDWGRLYFMIVPALILGTLLIIVLLPDFVLAWKN